MASDQKKKTTADIRSAVKNYFCAPAWATFFEVHDSTGFATRSADALTMSLYPSRGLELYGLEFKASRADWLRELKQPEKADIIASQCDRWAIVTTDTSILKEEELPDWWGWYICSGVSLRVKKRPQSNPHKSPISKEFLAAILRRAAETISAAPVAAKKELDVMYSKGFKDGNEWNEDEIEKARTQHRELSDKVSWFECETGLKVNEGWGWRDDTITAQQFNLIANLLIGNRSGSHVKDLKKWHGWMVESLRSIHESINTLGAVLSQLPPLEPQGNCNE